jgi:hypothetical protein
MSYVLTSYLVDLAELESVIGCKDQSIIAAVEAMIQEKFDDEDDEDKIAQSVALRHLIMGEPRNLDDATQYGWVLWDICRFKGEEQLPDHWGGVRWDAVEACGLENLLTKTGPPVELPPNQDMPSIGHIKRDNIAAYLHAAEETKAAGVLELLDEYTGWLETAATKNKDIVFFYG